MYLNVTFVHTLPVLLIFLYHQ